MEFTKFDTLRIKANAVSDVLSDIELYMDIPKECEFDWREYRTALKMRFVLDIDIKTIVLITGMEEIYLKILSNCFWKACQRSSMNPRNNKHSGEILKTIQAVVVEDWEYIKHYEDKDFPY